MINLNEIKIIDLSTVLAGPSVGTFFAELGAQIVKIEHPENGDVTRSWKSASESPNTKASAYFSSVNYKKDYQKLDLTITDDYEQFIELVKNSDIIISNFKQGDDHKLKITDSILRQYNPDIIIAKITGFGSESDRVAYDIILQAETGYMSINGERDSQPLKMPVALIDVLAAHHLKEGILLALMNRLKGGEAKTIQVSLYDAALSSLSNQASNYLMTGVEPQRQGNLHPNIAPYGEVFLTRDEKEITFAIGSNKHFADLCSYLKLELEDSALFQTNQLRVKNRKKLEALIQKKVSSLNSDDIQKNLNERKVPCALIKTIGEVLNDTAAEHLIKKERIEGEMTSRITSIAFKWE